MLCCLASRSFSRWLVSPSSGAIAKCWLATAVVVVASVAAAAAVAAAAPVLLAAAAAAVITVITVVITAAAAAVARLSAVVPRPARPLAAALRLARRPAAVTVVLPVLVPKLARRPLRKLPLPVLPRPVSSVAVLVWSASAAS